LKPIRFPADTTIWLVDVVPISAVHGFLAFPTTNTAAEHTWSFILLPLGTFVSTYGMAPFCFYVQ
jgi:hypothetical protein